MNLSDDKRRFQGGDSGAGGSLGTAAHAGPAHPLTVGAVGFGPQWTIEDAMAASIIRLEQENDELRAEVAMLREERAILQRKFAGVIEGGTNTAVPSPYGGHGCPSDLSPRTNLPEHITREVIRGDDGEAIFWPTCDHGAYPAHLLRDIAAHLDALNKEVQQ